MKIIEKLNFTEPASYSEWWVIVNNDGKLLAGKLESQNFDDAENEAKNEKNVVAICEVGHAAYNIIGSGFHQQVASKVLEHASKILDMPFQEKTE